MDAELIGIEKRFPGVRALRGVDLHLRGGEIHALVGQNGAGKSTLIKILTGAIAPDAGEIRLAGTRVTLHAPADAEAAGIAVVHQETQLFPELSVAENVVVAHPPTRLTAPFRIRDRRQARQRARELLHRLGIHVDVRMPAASLSPAERKLIEVARALSAEARVLVLDEPTAALEREEVERLFTIMRRLRAERAAVLFVSHKLDEVLAVSDHVTTLRDGAVLSSEPTSKVTLAELVRLIAEGELRDADGAERDRGAPVLVARDVETDVGGPDDLDVHEREIVALTGLLGSGAAAFARSLAGATPYRGVVTCAGREVKRGDRADAAMAGLGFVAEDRKVEGIVPELSVERNIALGSIGQFSRLGWLSRRKLRERALHYMAALDIRPRLPTMPAGNLSGGNQQKVLLARWLASGASVLVMEEPTHGVDVAAKVEIHALLRRYAANGGALVLVSRETAELLELSDRIGVFREGTLAKVLPRGTSEREIASYAQGVSEASAP